MKAFVVLALLGLVLCVAQTQADCGDAENKENDDGEVKAWFKNLGCQIKKGAEDLQESAKPIVDKIGTSAKDFGSSVAQKYDELKHKLTDDSSTTAPLAGIHDGPTEKIPLAPLSGDAASSPAVAPAAGAPVPAATSVVP